MQRKVLFSLAFLTALASVSVVFAQILPPPPTPSPSTTATSTPTTSTTATSSSSGDDSHDRSSSDHSQGSRDGRDSSHGGNDLSSFFNAVQRGGDSQDTHSQDILKTVVSKLINNSLVVPNAAAPRVLKDDSSQSEQSAQQGGSAPATSSAPQTPVNPVLAGAQLLQDVRKQASQPDAGAQIQKLVQSNDGNGVSDLIKTIVQSVARDPGAFQPLAPTLAQSSSTKDQNDNGAGATSSRIQQGQPSESDAAQAVKQLADIGKNFYAIDSAKKKVETSVSNIVNQGVDTAVKEAAVKQIMVNTAAQDTARNETDRAKLDTVRINASAQAKDIAAQVSRTVVDGAVTPQQVAPAIDSSLQNVARIVSNESGVAVSPPEGSKVATDQIQQAAQDIAQHQSAITERGGLDLYRDSDHDGISDYDEIHIYHTDPNNAYTGGGELTDGERVLLGLDPHVAALKPVPVESPKSAGAQIATVFEVTNIALVPAGVDASGAPIPVAAASSTTVATSAPVTNTNAAVAPQPAPSAEKQIRFSGRALPNSFVTLYIYSDPVVVTIKTDANGLWTYTLDKSLPDGNHQLYVATVDDQGKILAKSSPVPFTKTAEALSYEPLLVQSPTNPSPLDTLRQHFIVTATTIALLFLLIGILSMGFRNGNTPTPMAA